VQSGVHEQRSAVDSDQAGTKRRIILGIADIKKSAPRFDGACWFGLSGELGLTGAHDISGCAIFGWEMPFTWYVTFEVHKRGTLLKRRSPRASKLFETEEQAKDFARAKFNEGLIVHAGTIIPHLPRRTIPSSNVPAWLDGQPEQDDQDDAQGSDGEEPG
jgi:hypothetical protein